MSLHHYKHLHTNRIHFIGQFCKDFAHTQDCKLSSHHINTRNKITHVRLHRTTAYLGLLDDRRTERENTENKWKARKFRWIALIKEFIVLNFCSCCLFLDFSKKKTSFRIAKTSHLTPKLFCVHKEISH